MKAFFNFLLFPIRFFLRAVIWLCFMILQCSAFLFDIAGTIFTILGFAVLFTTSVQNGIILLVIAFLVSPAGIPMFAAWLLHKFSMLL